MTMLDFMKNFIEITESDFQRFQQKARPVWFCGRYFITKSEFLQKYWGGVMIIKTKINNKISFSYLVKVAKALQERYNPFIVDIEKARIVLNPLFKFSGVIPDTISQRMLSEKLSYESLFLNNITTKKDLINLLTKLRLYKMLESGNLVI